MLVQEDPVEVNFIPKLHQNSNFEECGQSERTSTDNMKANKSREFTSTCEGTTTEKSETSSNEELRDLESVTPDPIPQRTILVKELSEKPIEVPPKLYKNLLLSLDQVKFSLIRNRKTTMKRLHANTKEAKEHMKALKELVEKEMAKLDASAISLAQEMVDVAGDVFKMQHYLNSKVIDCEEQSLYDIIDTLSNDLQAIEDQVKSENRHKDLRDHVNLPLLYVLFKDNGYWLTFCLLLLVAANAWVFLFPHASKDGL